MRLRDVADLPAALTTSAYAEAFGYTVRGVQRMCREGRIPGARLVHGEWRIPTGTALQEFGIEAKEAGRE